MKWTRIHMIKENTKLTFEIKDGSYHPVDTYDRLYSIATQNAIINCFDKAIVASTSNPKR